METELVHLAERASGKMRRAIGRALPGEPRQELERIAAKDQRMARAGLLVGLRSGTEVWHKPVDALTRADHRARLEYEWATIAWLRGRIEGPPPGVDG